MIQYHSDYNPFKLIVEYFPDNHSGPLTLEQLYAVKSFLELGGIHCESEEEVVQCMFLMRDLGLLGIKKIENKNEIYYEVTKLYGK